MTEPPATLDPVLVIVATAKLRYHVRKAVVSSTCFKGVPHAMLRPLGPDLNSILVPEFEGISWCRGWASDARDALLAAWALYGSAAT